MMCWSPSCSWRLSPFIWRLNTRNLSKLLLLTVKPSQMLSLLRSKTWRLRASLMNTWTQTWTQETIHLMRRPSCSCRVWLTSRTRFRSSRIHNLRLWKWRNRIIRDWCTSFWETWLRKNLSDFSSWEELLIRTTTMTCSRRSSFWCRSGKTREGVRLLCLPLNPRIPLHHTCTPLTTNWMDSNSQHRGDRDSRSRQRTSRSLRLTQADRILEREDDLIISLTIQSLLIVILLHTISSLQHQFIALSSQLSQMNQYHILFLGYRQWFIIYFIPVVCPLYDSVLSILEHSFLSLLLNLILSYIRLDEFYFHFLVWLRRLWFFN